MRQEQARLDATRAVAGSSRLAAMALGKDASEAQSSDPLRCVCRPAVS
jgi:hypothetical protein